MERVRNLLFLAIGLLIIGWSFYAFLEKPAPAHYQSAQNEARPEANAHTLRAGDRVLPIEIADTDATREQGFSGREEPPSGHGILFVFEKPDVYGFWMKEMKFPLDIIWIGDDWTVLGAEKDALPESYPKIFYPPSPARYVLELPAGDAAAFSIDIGSKLYLDQ